MNICFVTESLNEKHGYGRVSVNLIRELGKLGINGPILTFKNSPVPKDLELRTKRVFQHTPLQPLSHPISLIKDWRVITEEAKNCDGIHFLTESFLATTIFGYRKPYIVTAHGTWAINPLVSNPISRMVFSSGYRHAEQVVTVSNETQQRLIHEIALPNIRTIYLGVKEKKRPNKSTSINGHLNILTVAAITPSKGLDIALEGVIQYAKTHKVNYTVIGGKGDKEYQFQLETYAKKLNFKNFVIRRGPSDEELSNSYRKADIFVLPSVEINGDFEGFGLILLESFAAGVPVIATQSGAIPEIIIDHETGLLVPQRNPNAIEMAIEELDINQRLKQTLVKNGLKALNKFSLINMINGYKAVYEEYFK